MNSDIPHKKNLAALFDSCPKRVLSGDDRIVVFSDLHMGNGSRNDSFRHNGEIFSTILMQFYAENAYHLILNGDVEDLQRFRLRSIVGRWRSVYHAFGAVADRGGLTRIVGNHDLDLLEGGPAVGLLAVLGNENRPDMYADPIHEGLRLGHSSGEIFIFHGHQVSWWYYNHNNIARLLLRYIANPLHISSPTVAEDSRKRFKIERRAYEFASERKILAMIGHTHRSLFESMSKADSVLFEIEALCREYPQSSDPAFLEARVRDLKAELNTIRENEARERCHASLYRENLLVPSLFNSGCVLGKHGVTCLEIERDILRLVYWFDSERDARYHRFRDHTPEVLPGTRFRRIVIKEESLPYIFSRVRLLA